MRPPKPIGALSVAALCAAAAGPALAHSFSGGESVGGALPLILIAAVIGLVLFLVFVHHRKGWTVLVTGGAGYLGSVLVPRLLARRHRVTVLDLYRHGEHALDEVRDYPDLRQIRGDVRDAGVLEQALRGCDAVIHLAPLPGEPSPGRAPGDAGSADHEAFRALVRAARTAGVRRFVHASCHGTNGDADAPELAEARALGFVTCTLRPAVICGPAPLRRLDTIVNDLTRQAVGEGRMRVPAGARAYPCIHIGDMADLYLHVLAQPDSRIDGRTFDAVAESRTARELAEIVRSAVGGGVVIETGPAETDSAPPPLSPDRMRRELGFVPRRSVADAVGELAAALRDGRARESLGGRQRFPRRAAPQARPD